jgi:hypothetical protein
MNDGVEKARRACADFRIQRRDDFAKICVQKRYNDEKMQESSLFRRFLHQLLKKRIGKAKTLWAGYYLDAPNKGYLNKDYYTYDKKYNRIHGE